MGGTAKFRDLWRGLEPRGQLTIVGAALAVAVTGYFLFSYAGRPSYSVLGSGLDPAQTAQIQKALDGAGVGYRISNGGTQVEVQSGQVSEAQVAIAAKGLSTSNLGSQTGFEIFDKQKLGVTDFQQKVDYQRALEGEIARQVEQIQGVNGADVQLVLPTDSLFADQASKASAAVLLRDGGTLDAASVASIAHLVASAVKGLDPQDVTITDDTGQLVWPTGDSVGGVSAASKLRAEQLYDSTLAAQINAMLVSTLGPNKGQARVHADLNVDQTTLDKVTYAKKGVPLSTDTSKETLNSKGGSASVPGAGTAANVPTYASTSGQGGTSNYLNQSAKTDYGVDKTIQHTELAPGTVNKLDVALLLDSSIPPAQARQIQQSVASMAGVDPKRGDTISVARLTFAAPPKPVKASPIAGLMANPLALAKPVLIGLAAIVFLFLMRRTLKRREGEGVAQEPTWLRELQQSIPIAELGAGQSPELQAAAERRKALRSEAEEIARKQPEQLAAQLGTWVKET